MAEIDQPRRFNDEISMSSSGVNIATGLPSTAGWCRNRQHREEPHRDWWMLRGEELQ